MKLTDFVLDIDGLDDCIHPDDVHVNDRFLDRGGQGC